jgi:hypothetical protein
MRYICHILLYFVVTIGLTVVSDALDVSHSDIAYGYLPLDARSRHVEIGNEFKEELVLRSLSSVHAKYKEAITTQFPIILDDEFREVVKWEIPLPNIYRNNTEDIKNLDVTRASCETGVCDNVYQKRYSRLLEKHKWMTDEVLRCIAAIDYLGVDYIEDSVADISLNGAVILFQNTRERIAKTDLLFNGEILSISGEFFSDQRLDVELNICTSVVRWLDREGINPVVFPYYEAFGDEDSEVGRSVRERFFDGLSGSKVSSHTKKDFIQVLQLSPDYLPRDLESIFSAENLGAQELPRLYLSRVGFNEDKTEAIIKALLRGSDWENSMYVVLRFTSDGWQVSSFKEGMMDWTRKRFNPRELKGTG